MKHLFTALFLVFLASWSYAVELHLKPSASVTGAQIFLKDLVQSPMPSQWADVPIASSPALGQERILSPQHIQQAVQAIQPTASLTFTGASEVKVSRPTRVLQSEHIRGVLEAQLTQRINGLGKATVLELADVKPLLIPADMPLPQVELPETVLRSEWSNATLRFDYEGRTVMTRTVRFKWQWQREAWQINRDAVVGESLNRGDVQLLTVNALQLRSEPVDHAVDWEDNVLARPLRTGSVITRSDVRPKVLVKRGEPVWVNYRNGKFSLTMKGTSLQAGGRGEMVNVRNDSSKKIVSARILSEGVLEYVH
jgi:flagella basal body P-ring formation protein FlgA